jgi:hypothetical protein
LAISLGTTGVKSGTIAGLAQPTAANGDYVNVCITLGTSAMGSTPVTYLPNQIIDSPILL